MAENIFEIDTLGIKKFICNAETGRWVLANSCDDEVIAYISKTVEKKRVYQNIPLILLNISRECNFKCRYCLAEHTKKQKQKMSWDVGKKAIDRVMELPEGDRRVVFHGSEPMTNYDLIKKMVLYAKKLNYRIDFSIQSNGSLFNEKNVECLVNNNVFIGISLDGMEKHQNKNRPYAQGRPSYKDVINNIEIIKRTQKKVSIISVVTNDNVNDLEEIVEHFEKLGITTASFNPVSSAETSLIPDVTSLIKNMLIIYDRYFNCILNNVKTLKIDNIRKYLMNFIPKESPSNCVQCSLESKYPLIGIDTDGSVYPCDFFWGNQEYLLGNIFDHDLNSIVNQPNDIRSRRNINHILNCSECNWKRFCGGGCLGLAVMRNENIGHYKSIYCQFNKTMLEYVAKRIEILHNGGNIHNIL